MATSFAVPGASQAPSRHSPFDQILEVEREQERRVHDALAALEQERETEEDAMRRSHDARVEEARAKAREELVRYKDAHLPQILKQAEERAARDIARVDRESTSRVDAAAKAVVDLVLSSDFPSLL